MEMEVRLLRSSQRRSGMKTSVQIYPRRENETLKKSDVLPNVEMWEAKRGKKLPSDYRHFLLTHFGGFPFPNRFDVSVDPWPEFLDENPQAIFDFYTWGYIQDLILKNYYYGGYPKGYLIIADAISPIHLLMGTRDDNWGKMFLWYHSTVDWGDDVNNERSLVLAADSFSDLILSLYDDGSAVARRNWLRGAEKARVEQIEL